MIGANCSFLIQNIPKHLNLHSTFEHICWIFPTRKAHVREENKITNSCLLLGITMAELKLKRAYGGFRAPSTKKVSLGNRT